MSSRGETKSCGSSYKILRGYLQTGSNIPDRRTPSWAGIWENLEDVESVKSSSL